MSDDRGSGGGGSEGGGEASRGRGKKSPQAFRTISEVAEDLHIPQHVLRFWESKFPQLKPLKRGGGRRYYRPEDIALLRRIGDLLYVQGYTIKGVQRLLRDGGLDDVPPGPGVPGELPLGGPAAAPPGPQAAPLDPGARIGAALDELGAIAAALRALAGGR